MSDLANYFPVRASVAANMSDYFEEDPAYETAFSLLRFATSEPPFPGYDFVRDLVAGEMAAILDGADVRATLTAANEEANAMLDEQLAGID